MAQIDSSIYLNQPVADIFGGFTNGYQKGLSMRDMIDKRDKAQKEEEKLEKINKAYSAGMITNPDGTVTYDGQKTVSELAGGGFGQEAYEAQNKFKAATKADLEEQRKKVSETTEYLGRASETLRQNPNLYQNILQDAKTRGYDVSAMPPQYSPEAQKALDYYRGQAIFVRDQLENQFKEKQLQSQALDRKEARDERRFQAGIIRDEKIQALKTPYGLANTPDDAKQIKEAHEAKSNFDNKLDQMIELREKHGGGALLNRDDVARGKQLSKDLLLEYKNMAKLGVLSKADEDIINAIIPEDPLSYNSPIATIQGQDPTLARLKSFKSDSDKDFETRIGTRTRTGIDLQGKPTDKMKSSKKPDWAL